MSARHRRENQAFNTWRDRRDDLVHEILGGGIICDRCGATLMTFARDCTADPDKVCPGFAAADEAQKEAIRRMPPKPHYVRARP
jgi:hypothetical protein